MGDAASQTTSAAFDALAAGYDAEFTATALGSVLRQLVWERAAVLYPPGARLLEIGCGTGEDAVHFARRDHTIVATDAAARMVGVARAKAERAGVVERVRCECIPMEALARELRGETFGGVFSNFGAINCVARVDVLAADLARLLAPGAPLMWVVMGRTVPWEWFWFLAHGQGGKAFRRLRRGGVEWRGMTVWYPSPSELTRALRPHFGDVRVAPLGFALPPSYAARWLERSPRTLATLAGIERAAQRFSALAGMADHYIVEATREPRHAGA
jgi:ubiquinone/menaquinone biosynthesis C-methylase UbiE